MGYTKDQADAELRKILVSLYFLSSSLVMIAFSNATLSPLL